MPSPHDIYIHCDELDRLPPLCRENWLYELHLLTDILRPRAHVLQVGCMDGTRIIALLEKRPDLRLTGLDIDAELLHKAEANFHHARHRVRTIHADITDKTQLADLGMFDAVLCLNNTLGYIADIDAALENMRKLGGTLMISVYGEHFTNALASEYFQAIGLTIEGIEGNIFHVRDFGDVKRFTGEEVRQWRGNVRETPMGYFSVIDTSSS